MTRLMTTAGRWSFPILAFALLIPFKVKADAFFDSTATFAMTPQNQAGITVGGPLYNFGPLKLTLSGNADGYTNAVQGYVEAEGYSG